MNNRKDDNVIIFGPDLSGNSQGYGGGKGGIVSAMMAILEFFKDSGLKVNYVSYQVRSFSSFWIFALPLRLLRDVFRLSQYLPKSNLIHVVADGGIAVIRSLLAAIISRICRKKIVVDVRGNALATYSMNKSGLFYRLSWRQVINASDRVLVQSRRTVDLLSRECVGKIIYQPNMLLTGEIPVNANEVLTAKSICVIFVGYCYRCKGVFDIITGCIAAVKRGLCIELSFVGQEHPEFSHFLDQLKPLTGFSIKRYGRKDRADIFYLLAKSDVFLFPTYHPGEGHPNVINEAMAHGLVIITTHVGAIDDILDDETAFFVDTKSPDQIAEVLFDIYSNPEIAREKGLRARNRLLSCYTSDRVLGRLESIYRELLKCAE